ncbi:MAG: SH3 domain-containing protein [Pseudonocardia sp.]|nr:SH3 domain-containing protein [Pseudonocardia sp.]
MPKLRVTGRLAALTGMGAVAAAAALVVTAWPALAADTQEVSCTDQVRVRSQPSLSAPVIGSCTNGEKITVDKTQNNFAHAVNKQGWVSVDYVSGKKREIGSSDDSSSDKPGDSDHSDKKKSHDDDDDDSGSPLGGL